ncbi:hypothetical protein DFA_04669 [Cavenderia fasciculata]|uniref:Uncharacterized protein n=1 Tax=Cavenderia fasciculata TaxID=261658 RepID=F4PQ76_CACFS|nr:uncharacterized protein DFA_04669 [Cavenderia fasciculata]EGG22539.1 hypothetical protein DFA_04669 [Cavenderia fasciculata]|eukprot:XP_004360390.1 hypothetical protein DFA_04669 [Cavenderia fasciculata]
MDRNSQNRSAPLDSTGKEASRRIDEQIELIIIKLQWKL